MDNRPNKQANMRLWRYRPLASTVGCSEGSSKLHALPYITIKGKGV